MCLNCLRDSVIWQLNWRLYFDFDILFDSCIYFQTVVKEIEENENNNNNNQIRILKKDLNKMRRKLKNYLIEKPKKQKGYSINKLLN